MTRQHQEDVPLVKGWAIALALIIFAIFGCADAGAQFPVVRQDPDYFNNVRPVGREKLDPTQKWVQAYPQPAIYDQWWKDVAACEGLPLDLNKAKHVRFVFVNSTLFHLALDDRELWGLADPPNMTIYIARSMIGHKPTVTHEMVHMLDDWAGVKEGNDNHPADRFEVCGLHTTWP